MSNQMQTGLVPLVEGQQSYNIAFSPAYGGVPSYFQPTVHMPSSSGEIFTVSADRSTLLASGVTVWLSGIPTAASVGGYINWYSIGPFAYAPVSPTTGITVPQLFHRIGRHGRQHDFTRLSMSELGDLCEAANAALQRLYNALPTRFKEKTEGFVLPAPATLTGVGVTRYSKTVSGVAFTSAQIGQTVVLDGDAAWNQVIAADTLLNPYMGATGTVGGTVYGNAWYTSSYPLDRIIGNPKFADRSQSALALQTIESGTLEPRWLFSTDVGCPCICWPQLMGNSQGESPLMVLRFAPAPSVAYAINIRLAFWPRRLTLADYDNATALVVPDQFIEPSLIPMCLQEFMSSPSWESRKDELRIDARGNQGEAFARNQPGQIGSPHNRIFTPAGF